METDSVCSAFHPDYRSDNLRELNRRIDFFIERCAIGAFHNNPTTPTGNINDCFDNNAEYHVWELVRLGRKYFN